MEKVVKQIQGKRGTIGITVGEYDERFNKKAIEKEEEYETKWKNMKKDVKQRLLKRETIKKQKWKNTKKNVRKRRLKKRQNKNHRGRI